MINYWDELNLILKEFNIGMEDICLCGSSVLKIANIRENHDVDLVVKSCVREMILTNANYLNKLLYYNPFSGCIQFSDNIECEENHLIMFGVNDDKLMLDENSDLISGCRVEKMELYIAEKILLNRKKDRETIALIEKSGQYTKDLRKKVNDRLEVARKNGWTIEQDNSNDIWRDIFCGNKTIYVFGIGRVGRKIYKRILKEGYSEKVKGFLVSKLNKEDGYLLGKKIYEIDEIALSEKNESIILIAVLYKDMKNVMEMLKESGFRHCIQGYQFEL